jgi:membrane-bound inhibitor of C-type lysozyme
MNKKYIFGLVIVALIILGFVFVYEKQKKSDSSGSTEKNASVITFYCEEGTLKAVFGKDNLTLSFGSSTLTLPHAISADGARYELDTPTATTTFWSKGDNAFMTVGDNQIYTNCVDGNLTENQNINTYTDFSKTFSFSYPNQFTLSGGSVGYSQDWSYGTNDLGNLLSVVHIPKSFLPGTNFGESRFTVGTSVDPDAVKNCLAFTYGGTGTTSKVMINGREFTKMNFTDAGAGNYYDTTSYRTIYNDQCYAVEYTIHSSNIYNYSPDQGIKEFDKAKINSVLENIVQRFKFN